MERNTLKDTLLRLNEKWCQSYLPVDQFAKYHGLTEQEMDLILCMVQSWEESNHGYYKKAD